MFNVGRLAARAVCATDAHAAQLNAITNATSIRRNGVRCHHEPTGVVPTRLTYRLHPWKPDASCARRRQTVPDDRDF
jgi:hypothetical protein